MQTNTEAITSAPQTFFMVTYTKDNNVVVDGVYQFATIAFERCKQLCDVDNICTHPIIIDLTMDLKLN